MDCVWVSLEVFLPLLLMMAVGYIIGLTGVMNDTSVWQTNRALFTVFLPMLVFESLYKSSLPSIVGSWLMIFIIAAAIMQFSISLCIVVLTEHDNAKRGVMLQGMFRGNFALYGIPLCNAIFGSDAAGTVSLLILILVPMFNILAVIGLEIFNGGRPNFLKMLIGIFTNPIVLATLAAVLLNIFEINLPSFVTTTVSNLASIATPLAFVLVGAAFSFKEVGACAKGLGLALLMKLIFFPAVFVGLGILFGFRGSSLAVILLVFSSPVAVSSFCMAQHMGGDDRIADQLVVFSTLFSIGTTFLFLFVLRWFGFV